MNDEPILLRGEASRELRDGFCTALEADDYAALRILSAELRGCADILPRSVCVTLGLPRGSTYALAVLTLFAL